MTIEILLMTSSILLGIGALYLYMRRREQEDLAFWAQTYNCPRLENESEDAWRARVIEKRTRFMRGQVIR